MKYLKAWIRNIYNVCSDENENNTNNQKLNINIPFYQRPYRWGEKNINYLFQDYNNFKKEKDEKSEYFTGSVVAVKKEKNNKVFYDMVDGQQRMTTIFLINYVNFLMLRGYLGEIICLGKTSKIISWINKLEDCYKKLLGNENVFKIQSAKTEIERDLEKFDDYPEERERICEDIENIYKNKLKLADKDFSDMEKYKKEYKAKLDSFFMDEELCLKYSRESYNKKLKEALSRVVIKVTDDSKPEIYICDGYKDDVVNQYTKAIEIIFRNIMQVEVDGDRTLDKLANLLNYIENMLQTLSFCVIVTEDEDDAYTLFEVLNDRAYELDDLELVKNLFLKKYCNLTSEKDDDFITQQIEEIDRIWVDEVFGSKIGVTETNLVAYLGIVYLTGNADLALKQQRSYRELLEKDYFKKVYDTKPYEFVDIKNDILVFKLLKTLFDQYEFAYQNAAKNMLKIECEGQKSITYRTLHLINTLGYPGVFPGIINMIISSFIQKEKKNGIFEIDVNDFQQYIKELAEDKTNSKDEFIEIHKCSFNVWKMIMLGKDHKVSRDYTKRIIEKFNYQKHEYSEISINETEIDKSRKEYSGWTNSWRYGNNKDKTKLKLKLLFIDLFAMERLNCEQENKLKIGSLQSQFKTENLHLDHLEARNIEEENREKYFIPENNGDREEYVNGLGNMMLLDSANNIEKSNKYLVAGMDYYDKMGKHWLIDEISNMIQSDEYSNDVNGVRVPNEKFFNERKRRLRNYFYAIIDRKLEDTEMTIPNLDKE